MRGLRKLFLVCIASSMFLLTSCSLAGPSKSDFVGTWQIYSATYDDETITHEEILEIRESLSMFAGSDSTIDFDEDGHVVIDSYGQVLEGTWSIDSSGTSLTLTVDNESMQTPYADGHITLELDGDQMVYEKLDDVPNMDHEESDLDWLYDGSVYDDDYELDSYVPNSIDEDQFSSSEEEDAELDAYIDEVEEIQAIDVLVADNASVRIHAYAIGDDYEGDPGVLLSIQNKTDHDIYVVNVDDFSVGGVPVNASLYRHLNANEERKAFLFFTNEEIQALGGITTITGTLASYDENHELIEDYFFGF